MTKVEQCWKLNISKLKDRDEVAHIANAECEGQEMAIAYNFNCSDDSMLATITFFYNGEVIRQIIDIETAELPLGDRPYFRCQCGNRCSVLYLKPDGSKFACRECNKLIYEVKTVNKKLMNGVLYQVNRINKLIEKSDKIDRAFYNGKPTKKVESFIRLREKWGV